jgi:hypothetical protein
MKDRFKNRVADVKAHHAGDVARFVESCAVARLGRAEERDHWIARMSALMADERLTPEARAMLGGWVKYLRAAPSGYLSRATSNIVEELESHQQRATVTCASEFGGHGWRDPAVTQAWVQARNARRAASRPEWMRDRNALPLRPPKSRESPDE